MTPRKRHGLCPTGDLWVIPPIPTPDGPKSMGYQVLWVTRTYGLRGLRLYVVDSSSIGTLWEPQRAQRAAARAAFVVGLWTGLWLPVQRRPWVHVDNTPDCGHGASSPIGQEQRHAAGAAGVSETSWARLGCLRASCGVLCSGDGNGTLAQAGEWTASVVRGDCMRPARGSTKGQRLAARGGSPSARRWPYGSVWQRVPQAGCYHAFVPPP